MPSDVFEKKIIKYMDYWICNITNVAKEYIISACNVLIRGENLHNFR